MKSADLLVLGGGPAGTTLAALVKKHDPKRRVVLLEKEKGPRHHIGESLLPGLVPVLKELGVFEKIDSAGFPRKIGANYVWGKSREPWENDFNEVNVSAMLERYGELPPRLEYAWQVRRSEYDEILLRHAEECGVEVLRGLRAAELLEEGKAVAGVAAVDAAGKRRELRASFTADCTGQAGFLSRFRRVRRYDDRLKNVAGYAYYKGARWKYEFSGHPDKTKIFICMTGSGWFWYIPIAKDVVSVGFVTRTAKLKKSGKSLEALFEKELAACGEIAPLLKGASRIEDFEGTGQGFFTHSDWSYLNVAASGPGWLAAGDAAVFVDPILSSGVTLAHLSAHRAAYTLLSGWRADSDRLREQLWADYDGFCRESAAQFLVLALFWYGNDPAGGRWWKPSPELLRTWLPVDLSDKGAFVAVSAGLTRHYERLLSTRTLQEEQAVEPKDFPFLANVMGLPSKRKASEYPRLLHPWREEVTFVPVDGEGRLSPAKRVRFLKEDPEDAVKDAFNPRKVVTRWHLALLSAVDGRRSLAELKTETRAAGAPDWWLDGPALVFLKDLEEQGVLAWSARRAARPAAAGAR